MDSMDAYDVEQALREVFERIGERAPTLVDADLTQPPTSPRRRIVGPIIAVAAGVALIAAISAVALRGPQGSDERDLGTAAPSTEGSSTVAPARGYRAVAAFGLVFEVPEMWGTMDSACDGSPTQDTVLFGGGRLCIVPDQPRVSSLRFISAASDIGSEALASDLESRMIDGAELTVTPLRANGDLWVFAVESVDRKGVAIFESTDQDIAQHAWETLRIVPTGWSSVPYLKGYPATRASNLLREMDLTAAIDGSPSGSEGGIVTKTDPEAGTVVPAGSTVTLSISSRGLPAR